MSISQVVKYEYMQLRDDRSSSIKNQLMAKRQWCFCCNRPEALCRCIKVKK